MGKERNRTQFTLCTKYKYINCLRKAIDLLALRTEYLLLVMHRPCNKCITVSYICFLKYLSIFQYEEIVQSCKNDSECHLNIGFDSGINSIILKIYLYREGERKLKEWYAGKIHF